MTTDDTVRTMTDAWGRPVEDGVPSFGPLDGDEDSWPLTSMLVLTETDLVTCAERFARAYSSASALTIWLLCIDEYAWTTRDAAELLDLPPRPPPGAVLPLVADVTRQLAELAPGSSVLVAIAAPDGGDRGPREEAWSRALLEAAQVTGLPVRGIVAVGRHRARLLHRGERTA